MMYKNKFKSAFLIALGVFAGNVFLAKAQAPTIAAHKAVFSQSLRASDINTAIQAANYIVAADKNSSYKDSLAVLYYNAGNINAAYYWSTTSLAQQPGKPGMLEVKAQCLKKANNPIGAIDAYTELLKVRPLTMYAYELMNLQYSVQRLLECAALGQQTLQANKIDSTIAVSYSTDGKTVKQTLLKAAILNVYGLALADLKKLPEAEQAFQQALLVDKNYVLAQKNLEMTRLLEQSLQKGKEEKAKS